MQGRRGEFNTTPLPDWFMDHVLSRRTGYSPREIDEMNTVQIERLWELLAIEDEIKRMADG